MEFKELTKNVLGWANDRSLIEHGNTFQQYAKFMEEANEILIAMNKMELLIKEAEALDVTNNEELEKYRLKDKSITDEHKDAYGDTLVTLIISAAQYGYDLTDCLNRAYNEIKDRTGKTVDGTFIKD